VLSGIQKYYLQKNGWHFTKIDASDPSATKGIAGIMGASFITIMVTCMGWLWWRLIFRCQGFVHGVKLGALTGICFGIPAISNSYLYEKKPFDLHLINGGNTLVGSIIAAIIICVWQ